MAVFFPGMPPKEPISVEKSSVYGRERSACGYRLNWVLKAARSCSCCESWRHLGGSCWQPSSIISIHLAHAVVYTCEVAALHRQVTNLNRKGDSSSLEGLRSQKSLARSSCKESSIRDQFIHSTNINTICSAVLEPVGTQLLVKLKNTVAESDVTFK